MMVKYHMTSKPVTIDPDATIADAVTLLRENNISRLPVVEKNKLVGIVTSKDLSEVSPSPATTLSIFEINYLLSKTKIRDIMKKKVFTIESGAFIEEAALLMRNKGIGAIPVMDNDELVGIITESDIFDAFIEIMGFRETGGRLTVELEDKPHALADIADIFGNMGANIANVVAFHEEGRPQITFRIYKTDEADIEKISRVITEKGYTVKSVIKSH